MKKLCCIAAVAIFTPLLSIAPGFAQSPRKKVVLLNEGGGTHVVRLHDHGDVKWANYRVGPHDELITRRRWENDTEIYVDGKHYGNISEIAHEESINKMRVWAIYFDGHDAQYHFEHVIEQ